MRRSALLFSAAGAMWRRGAAVGLLGLISLLSGCSGGAVSESDIRGLAIRRATDEEELPASGATSAPAKVSSATSDERGKPKAKARAAAPAQNPSTAESPPPDDDASLASATENAATPPPATAPQTSLSDTRQPPATPLSASERCQTSAANLDRIIAALVAHQKEKGVFPKPSLPDGSGAPGLSWRVALLPQLGYANLYHRFHLSEPWNSPNNMALLKHIPAVYQSPERFDEKTNYLLPVAGNTAFLPTRAVRLRDVEDGVEHTVFLVEVDDELAVPWTQPQDYSFARAKPVQGLGRLRNGQIFLAWGNGATGAVPAAGPVESLRAMFTADAGESFTSYSISRPLDEATLALAAASGPGEAEPATSAPIVAVGTSAPNSAAVAPPTPANALAQSYSEAAQAAYRHGKPGDALRWYYASLISQPERPGPATHHWVAALRRPVPAVHFGVGLLRKPGSTTSFIKGPRTNHRTLRDATRRPVDPVGTIFLDAVEAHAVMTTPGSLASVIVAEPSRPAVAGPRADRQSPCPVSYLGEGTAATLRKMAIDGACDVLVLLDIHESPDRQSRSVSCQVLDVARNASLLRLPRIYWMTGAAGHESLTRDDDFRQAQWRLSDLLEQQLAFGQWPDSLKPKHAAARVAALAEAKGLYTPAALTEMCVYRDLKLIDNRQLLDGFRGRLGDEEGETLMLGDERARSRLLRRWLPTERPQRVHHAMAIVK